MAEKVKRALWKSVFKWVWWTLFSLFVLLLIGITVAINFVFTSARLTPFVEKTANEYLNADVQVGEIELTFFSTFPDFGVKVSDVRLVSGVFRDTTRDAVASDSLMYVEKVLITVDPLAYLKKKQIKIKDFILDTPRIYAFIDAEGEANWNVYDMASDTTVADTGDVEEEREALLLDIKNVRIRGGHLIFDDRSTDLYFRLEDLNAGVDGNFLGRTADLQLTLNARNILFWQEGKLLVKKLAFGVETGMSINRDSLLYTLDKAVFEVNGIKFGAGGTVRADTLQRLLDVNVKYGIHIPSLRTLIDLVPEAVLQKDKKAEIRGDVLCTGDIRGHYGKKNVPLITAFFRIKDGYVAYEGMPSRIEELNTDFEAVVDLQKQQPSEVKLNHFCLKGGATDIDAEGVVENLLGDPVIKAEVKAKVDFDDITRIFPLTDGVTCQGKIDAFLRTNVLMSDITGGNYGRLKLGGWCKMQEVSLFIPQDSIAVRMKSAGVAFATNRKNENVSQGVDLLNGIVGYCGLDVYVRNRLNLKMDTAYVTLKTTPLRDTTTIATVKSGMHVGRTLLVVRDTLLLGLKRARVDAKLMPTKRNPKVPRIESRLQIDSLRVRSMGNRLNMAKADICLNANRNRRNEKIWIPSGYIDFEGLRAYTPCFPLRMSMPGTRIHFNRKEIQLDSARLRLGRSDVRLTGSVTNLWRAFFRHDTLYASLAVKSRMINCNQLMRALDAGTTYMNKAAEERKETVTSDEEDMDSLAVVSDTLEYAGRNSVFVVPPGIDFLFRMDIDRMIFGKLLMNDIRGEVRMKNQCIELSDLSLRSAAANMDATAIYRATDTLRAYTGFALKMHDIRIDSLVRMLPSIDTLFPMLRSFEGEVDFHVSAESWLDSTFMVDLPTLRAAAYLDGHDLVLMDGETFAEISKMLWFKNKKRNMIDSISVDVLVRDGVVEIFPFLLEIDRYKVAVGGEHNIDMSFKYHVSLLKSPLPFRAGVDISGTLEKMKFRVTKAKYKDWFIPSRKANVDSAQLNLRQRIRTILRDGGHNELDD